MLPFTKTYPIRLAIASPMTGESLEIHLVDLTWDRLFDTAKLKGQLELYDAYSDLAGDRYLTKVTWDAENFIVTIYDARPDTEPDSQT